MDISYIVDLQIDKFWDEKGQIWCIVGRFSAKFCTLFLSTMHHFEINNIPYDSMELENFHWKLV